MPVSHLSPNQTSGTIAYFNSVCRANRHCNDSVSSRESSNSNAEEVAPRTVMDSRGESGANSVKIAFGLEMRNFRCLEKTIRGSQELLLDTRRFFFLGLVENEKP